MIPRIKGTSVRGENQANMTFPQETGIKKLMTDAASRKPPIQSNVISLESIGPGFFFKWRIIGIKIKPIPQIGRLIQKIHLHVTFCANEPLINGSVTEPTAHVKLWKPNQAPRCRSGTRSVIKISVRLIIPPPLISWMVRAARRIEKFLATAATTESSANSATAVQIVPLRSKSWDIEAKMGWTTVLVKKKDVPHQKASTAVPRRFCAIILRGMRYNHYQNSQTLQEEPLRAR